MSDANRRKARLQEELNRILPIIQKQYQPERIILFGSLVAGTVGPWSDLDLAIIKRTRRRFLDRILDVTNLVGAGPAADFFVYTPEEFIAMAKDNYFVREEIITKGKILYEKNQIH
ncbi:nucleotidyltransferase domain-containing protein [Candidatus Gottesmanbacteria bacterium]|nr:nucleotidyltransferase domain-containing protein [Candidatus Gottesmanbacteria bacterium]